MNLCVCVTLKKRKKGPKPFFDIATVGFRDSFECRINSPS